VSPRRRVKDKWPWPSDSALERARRIAGSYRTAVLAVDPDMCARLDATAIRLDQGWVVPEKSTEQDLDGELKTGQVAARCYVTEKTVDAWAADGLPFRKDSAGLRWFRLGDVLDFDAKRRRQRVEREKAG
jgi:hypothetical protein